MGGQHWKSDVALALALPRGMVTTPSGEVFPAAPKPKTKRPKSHLVNLNYILCSNFDENKLGGTPFMSKMAVTGVVST